ncbi:Thioredoxin reductase [Nucleospora cyclopteri]
MNSETDVVIIGSGPAAYTAALFLNGVDTVLFEGDYNEEIGPGGQLTTTTAVDNYPGFPKGTTGPEMMLKMKDQARNKKVKIITEIITAIESNNNEFLVISKKQKISCKAVIIATGASAKKLVVPNSNKYWTKGISACAVCDGYFFMNKVCAVIGGGDTALEESLYLANICSKVIIIHRRDVFRARNDKVSIARNTKNVEIKTFFVLKECKGDESALKSIVVENTKTGKLEEIDVDGLFFAIGHQPNTKFLADSNGSYIADIEENQYLKTNDEMETTKPGIFACGDVQDYTYRQAVTAAASGCVAAQSCLKFLKENN